MHRVNLDMDPELVTQSNTFLKEAKFKPLNCTRILCLPGYYKTYGVIERNNYTGKFDQIDGLKCVLCGVNTIKIGYNDGPCVPCQGRYNVDNGLRTACVDPYKDVDLSFETDQIYISISLITFGSIITLCSLVIFIVKRDTPIVRATDANLAITNLVFLLSIFGSSYYAHLERKTTIYKCIVRNLNLSILYAFNVAFIYSKSLKIINALSSNVILTRNEIKKTQVMQLFSIFMFLFVIDGILLILYIQFPPEIRTYLKKSELLRVHYCNVDFQGQILMAFLIVFQLICLVQAFRGRNLPGPMNDAMSMVYLILITTVTFAITFPISYFGDQLDKEFIHFVALTVNSICSVLFLYGKKCFIIIFKAKKNTRDHFNKKRMKALSSQVGLQA